MEMTPAGMKSIFASAEQLLYNHALTLAREAALSESCRPPNYVSSEVLYGNALTLLEVVLADAHDQVMWSRAGSDLSGINRLEDAFGLSPRAASDRF